MKVNINELKPGCILTADVWKSSNTPLLRKKTVLSIDHIRILNVFLVNNVFVEQKLVNGQVFKPNHIIQDKNEDKDSEMETVKVDSFFDRYLKAVQQYKKLFMNWQAGTKIDTFSVRKVFLPLYENEPTKDELMQLHHYSTKEDYIYYHSVSVSVFSYMLGKKVGLEKGEVIQLGLAGLLSDCGMSKLSFNVFDKKESLTAEEYEEVKKHPVLGYRMLEDNPGFSKNALLGIIQHHEREDGSGYPLHLEADQLNHFSKIIAVADVYHAMTSERKYRSKQSPYRVMGSLKIDQFGKLDHNLLNHFLQLMLDLSIGRKVRLNNGLVGEVLYQNVQDITRPIVKVNGEELFDLGKMTDVFIQEELPLNYSDGEVRS